MSAVNRLDSVISYVDFPPRCAGAGNVICTPDYERFDVLVARANDWLRRNGHVRVRCCESIEVKGRYDGIVDTNRSSFFEADHIKRKMRNLYIRALRLWVVPRGPDDNPEPQQIGYVNVVPARSEAGIFDSFGDTVKKFNNYLRQRPLPGKVLNVESQEMKFHEWGVGVDPDESCWVESVKYNISFLVVIRVFYEVGPPAYEEIGCADFVPGMTEDHVTHHSFELFGEVVRKASTWVQQQRSVRVTNVQSIDYKLQHTWAGEEVDTQRSFFTESGRHTTRYLRILRICFVKVFNDSTTPKLQKPVELNYVTFEPFMVSSGGIIGIPLFESLGDTMKRAMAWFNKQGDLKVLGAETVPIRMFSGNQFGNHETTYTWNRGEQKEFWLLVLRIFINGTYSQPPPDMLPLTFDPKTEKCCSVM